jgi:co-chaperonin GroES (HSP10)
VLPDPRTIKPIGARVVIEIEPRATISKGGIELPVEMGVEKVKPKAGRIIAAGPGKVSQADGSHLPMPVAVGDRVVFDAFLRENGCPLDTVDGKEHCLANALDLIAVVSDDVDVTLF